MKTFLFSTPLLLLGFALAQAQDSLPSWNDGDTRDAIIEFVQTVTDSNSEDFVPESERIAVFDNDGNLWAEKPVYFQLLFAVDRVKELAPEHPEWKTEEPFASVLKGDLAAVSESGHEGIFKLITATHAGMTVDEFNAVATDWIQNARHPETGRPYTEMVYQPMLELLAYLRENGFQTWIVSGGGIDFMRPWTEEVYGIPPEQVVGSSVKVEYEVRDGNPVLVRLPEIDFIDDKEGKPVGIQRHIGRKPIFASGNSDGDFQMLEYVTSGDGPSLGVLLHHSDAEREWAYDRESSVGQLDRGLDEANQRGWIVVDMKEDWEAVFPPAD